MLSSGFEPIDKTLGGFIEGEVNSLLYDASQLRTYFLWKVVSSCLKKDGLVYYVDLDTAFTTFIEQEARSASALKNLVLFIPALEEVEDVFSHILSVASPPDLIVVDSVASFYSFFEPGLISSEINRTLGLYISLLQSFASRYKTCVIITSLIRARRLKASGPWFFSYPGGKVLAEKSALVLMFRSGMGFFQAKVLKHPLKGLVGSAYKIPIDQG
ncbi:MAG: hypothetical protein QW815_05595 [Nitrososphaerota archaeon]